VPISFGGRQERGGTSNLKARQTPLGPLALRVTLAYDTVSPHIEEGAMNEPIAAPIEPGFAGFYRYYLALHQTRGCRWLHVGGLAAAAILVMLTGWFAQWWLLLLAPPLVYACAWAGHYFIEGNSPASLQNPWLAFLSYWRMIWDTFRGRQPL
jgi:hypothetical protein